MDEYGTLSVCKEDAESVLRVLITNGSCVFPFSGNKQDAMIVCATLNFGALGVMPFGGSPRGRVYVGIYGIGCNHLSMGPIHPKYIEEKLSLDQENAEYFSQFWEMIWSAK